MKDYIQDKYGFDETPPYGRLQSYVVEAWDAVPTSYPQELLNSMSFEAVECI